MSRYYAYAQYFQQLFGGRVQKLSVDAGFSCPHRGGREGIGGCTFCNNEAFNPSYCRQTPTITAQLDEGIRFHQWRYRKAVKYVAYFQAYSNTFAPIEVLRHRYEEALNHPMISGIIIGTRPDCVDDEVLDYLKELSHEHYVAVEYGIESCYDDTLVRVNRGHDFATTQQAIQATADRGLPCGGHLILGLPGEDRSRMLNEAHLINELPLSSLKLHQLQILKGSAMEGQYREALANHTADVLFPHFSLEEYITLVCDFLELLRPDIVMERFAGEVPPRFQAVPERSWRNADGSWVRNEVIPRMVEAELERRNSHQGSRFNQESLHNQPLATDPHTISQ